MNDFDPKIKSIFAALKSERLSDRERFVMREELHLSMKKHPVRPPFYIQLIDHWYEPGALGQTFMGRHVFASAFALVVIFGAGSSYAAQGALPGDALYSMKVNINEQVVGALAVSQQAKIDWSAELSTRRLEEAESLAADGTLTVEKSATLAHYFDKATSDFDTRVAALTEEPESEHLAEDASSMQEVSLAAHANVLENMSTKLPTVSEALSPLITKLRNKVDGKKGRQNATVIAVATTTTQTLTPVANKGTDTRALEKARLQKERAEKRLKEVRALVDQSKSSLGTTTYTLIEDEASTTLRVIKSADAAVDEGDFDGASRSYKNAIQVSVEAKAGLNAQIRLDQSSRSSGKSQRVILFSSHEAEKDD